MFLTGSGYEPCIFMDGPYKGKHAKVACIGPGSPCDFLLDRQDDIVLKYEARFKDGQWEKDHNGFFCFYFVEPEEEF